MRILAYQLKFGHPAPYDNMNNLINALSNLGHMVVPCDLSEDKQVGDILSVLLDNPRNFDMSIGFNNVGLVWSFAGNEEPVCLYEKIDIPHVSVMLDEPFNKCVLGYDCPCKNHIVTYLDRSDLKALDFMYPDKRMKKLFLPLGGTVKSEGLEALCTQKEYEVVVSAATWVGDDMLPSWHSDGLKKSVVSILDDVAYILKNYPVNVMTAFTEVLNARGMYDEEYLKAFQPHFWPILLYIKSWRRHKMVQSLVEAGFKVHVFGSGWEKVSFVDELINHGGVSYGEMLDVISKTKVLVQDQALFNNGAHDRVFTSMLNGAVVVSEYSSYLDEIFEDKRDLFMFDWQHTKEQMEIIHKLLEDEPYRQSIAMSAYGKAVKEHKWENRAERIVETVEIFAE